MKIEILAGDSLGTRSMATFVETKDTRILIDPGVALGPLRFGLPPHPLEEKRLEKHWKEIKKRAKKAEILSVSHYHYDHHNPEEPEIYKGKKVFLKDPNENINKSQKERAKYFLSQLDSICDITYAENKKITIGKTKIEFSKAVPHGPSTRLGYVVETYVHDGNTGESFIHTSDVEGPPLKVQMDFIIKKKPDIIFLDGPLSYIMQRYGRKNLEESFKNMKKILDNGAKILIYDHHFLRDPKFREKIAPVVEHANKKGKKVVNVAEFMKKRFEPLEMMRKELYERYPV